jgi:hypothetical protein
MKVPAPGPGAGLLLLPVLPVLCQGVGDDLRAPSGYPTRHPVDGGGFRVTTYVPSGGT